MANRHAVIPPAKQGDLVTHETSPPAPRTSRLAPLDFHRRRIASFRKLFAEREATLVAQARSAARVRATSRLSGPAEPRSLNTLLARKRSRYAGDTW